jgi:hypothetical protein
MFFSLKIFILQRSLLRSNGDKNKNKNVGGALEGSRGRKNKFSKEVMFLGPNYFGFYIIEDPGRILAGFMSFLLAHRCFFIPTQHRSFIMVDYVLHGHIYKQQSKKI